MNFARTVTILERKLILQSKGANILGRSLEALFLYFADLQHLASLYWYYTNSSRIQTPITCPKSMKEFTTKTQAFMLQKIQIFMKVQTTNL